jgi:hypothetical protein
MDFNGLLGYWVLQHSSTPKIQYSITPISRGDGSSHTTAMASLPPFCCRYSATSKRAVSRNQLLAASHQTADKRARDGIVLV